jgi:hypothetical protein
MFHLDFQTKIVLTLLSRPGLELTVTLVELQFYKLALTGLNLAHRSRTTHGMSGTQITPTISRPPRFPYKQEIRSQPLSQQPA